VPLENRDQQPERHPGCPPPRATSESSGAIAASVNRRILDVPLLRVASAQDP